MNCSPTQSDIITAIQNKKAFHTIKQGMLRDESVTYLEFDNNNFIKDDSLYKVEGTNVGLNTTVTTRLNKNEKFDSPRAKGSAEIGNFIHDALQEYGNFVLGQIQGKNVKQTLSLLPFLKQPNLTNSSKVLDQRSRDNLFETVINQFKFAYESQNLINQRQNLDGIPIIKLENLVIDPVDSIGGTIDFLAILSDNTFIIREYTSISTHRDQLDVNGNLRSDVTLVHYKKLEKNKLQLQQYSKILINRYGFKGVHSSRIIPLKSYSLFNRKTKTFDNNITYVAGPGQDNLIEEIIPFTEKTGFNSLDDFMSEIDRRIEKLSKNKNIADRERIAKKIGDLQNIKHEITIKKSLNNVLDYLNFIRGQFENIDSLSIDELLNIKHDLDLFKTIIDSTFEFKSYLESSGFDISGLDNQITQITNAANVLSITVKEELFNKKLNHVVAEATGEKIVDEFGNVIPFTPDGYFSQWFYQLSQFNNPIFQTLTAKLDTAHAEKNRKILELQEQVITTERDVLRVLKSKGLSWQDFISIIVNPKTDNLIGKVDGEWFKSIEKMSGGEYAKIFDVVEYFDYTIRQKQFIEKVKSLYPDDLASQQREIDSWNEKNNLSLDSNGDAQFPEAWIRARNNGKLVLKEDKIVYSKEFQKIKDVPEYLAYYNLLESKNREFRHLLGVDYKNLPNNFIPNIRKVASERIDEWGAYKGIKSATEDFIKDFSVREDDLTDEGDYLKRDVIPKFFLNPFRDKDGNTIIGEKSYQLGRSLLLFAKMAYNFDEMSKIEGEVSALKEFLVEKGQEIEQGKNGIKVNLLGNIKTIKTADLASTFDKFVQMYLYGLHVEPVLDDKSGKYEKMLLQMKNYFTLKKLGLNIISATGGFISAKIQSTIVGKTGIYYNEKQYNNALKSMVKDRKKFLALSAYFDPMGNRYNNIRLDEKVLGEAQFKDSSQRGWINQYVNSRLLMKPYSIGDETIDEIVTYSLAQNYYVNSEGILKKAQFDEDYETYKGRFISDLFMYDDNKVDLNLPENQKQKVWTAFRKAVQVVQSGIKGTIPDSDKAVWQGQLAGHLLGNFKSWIPGVMTERFGKIKFDKRVDTVYMGRFTAIMQELGTSKINNKNEALQLGVFIKDILLPKLAQLSLHVASFHTIGGYFKGFKMKDDGTVRLMYEQWLRQNPSNVGKVSYKEFRNVQEKQLKAAIIEMRMILAFTLLAVLAMGDWDDDGEKDYRKYLATRKLVSLILKVKQEISFFVNPTEFINLTKNPIPMVGLLQDAVRTVSNTSDELFDVVLQGDVVVGKDKVVIGEKDNKDRKNLLSYSHSWIPGFGGLAQFLDILSDDTQYNNTGN